MTMKIIVGLVTNLRVRIPLPRLNYPKGGSLARTAVKSLSIERIELYGGYGVSG